MTDWLPVTLPIACLLGLAATHVLLLRAAPAMRPYSAYGLAFSGWLLLQFLFDVVAAWYFPRIQWLDYGPANLAAYIALAYCYFHFFNLGETGRRMRLLIELRAHPEGLTQAELLSRYGAQELMQRRIDRLLVDGQVIQKDGNLILNGKTMSTIAELIASLRRIVLGSSRTSNCTNHWIGNVTIARSNTRFALMEITLWAATLALVLFSLRRALFDGVVTFAHDNLYWGFGLYRFYAEEALSNRFTLWNPFSHGGESLITAYFQLRMFDPVSALMAQVTGMFTDSAAQMFSWDRVVRIYLGCIGAYLVIRDAVASRFVRLALIPIVGLSSLAFNGLRQNGLSDQFYCAVFSIYFLFRILEHEDYRWRNWIGVAVLFGASIQSYFFTGGTLAFMWILLGMLLFRREKLLAVFARGNLPRFAASIGLVSVMALPMFVYYFQLSGDLYYSARFLPPGWTEQLPKGGPFDDIRSYDSDTLNTLRMPYAVITMTGTNLSVRDFLTLWSGPQYFYAGEAALFIGTLPFIIAVLGLVAGKHPAKRVWMVFLLGMSVLALGRDGGVHYLLYHVLPPLWFIRHTHGLSPFICLALLFFFALGFQLLLQLLRFPNAGRLIRYARERLTAQSFVGIIVGQQRVTGRREPAQLWLSLGLLICALAAMVAIGLFASPLLSNSNVALLPCLLLGAPFLITFLRWAMRPKRAGFENLFVWCAVIVVLLVGAVYQITLPTNAFDIWRRPVVLALGLGLLLFAAVRFRQGTRILLGVMLATFLITIAETPTLPGLLKQYLWFFLVPLIVGVVLWLNAASRLSLYFLLIATFGMQHAYLFSRSRTWVGIPPEMPAIHRGESPRLLPRAIVAQPPEAAIAHDIPQIQAVRYLEVLQKTPASIDPLRTYPENRLSLEGTDFSQIKNEGVWNSFVYYRNYARLVFSGLDSKVLEKTFLVGELPLQFRSNWVVAPDFEAYLRGLQIEQAVALLDRSVVLAEGPGVALPPQSSHTPQSSIRVLDYTYDLLSAEVSTDRAGILYFADGFDPSWKAIVNGATVPILRANGNFKAVAVPEGRSTVIFEYAPVMFVRAIWIFQGVFVFGLLFIFLAPLAGRVSSRRFLARS